MNIDPGTGNQPEDLPAGSNVSSVSCQGKAHALTISGKYRSRELTARSIVTQKNLFAVADAR